VHEDNYGKEWNKVQTWPKENYIEKHGRVEGEDDDDYDGVGVEEKVYD
jgi:hypothetical protein